MYVRVSIFYRTIILHRWNRILDRISSYRLTRRGPRHYYYYYIITLYYYRTLRIMEIRNNAVRTVILGCYSWFIQRAYARTYRVINIFLCTRKTYRYILTLCRQYCCCVSTVCILWEIRRYPVSTTNAFDISNGNHRRWSGKRP